MAETQRTVADLITRLADNTSGAISPEDVRDIVASLRPSFGQIYVSAAAAAAVTISNTTGYFEATAPAWTLSASAHNVDESDGNGRLTYTGATTLRALVTCTVSMTCAGSNDVLHFRIGKNGVSAEASEVQRKIGTGADVGAAALTFATDLTTGDHISLFVRNSTATDDVTIEVASLQLITAIS
jgi:hypothetical protein